MRIGELAVGGGGAERAGLALPPENWTECRFAHWFSRCPLCARPERGHRLMPVPSVQVINYLFSLPVPHFDPGEFT